METKTWILIASIITLGVVLFFFFSPSLAKKATATAPGPFDLSKVMSSAISSDNTKMFTGTSPEGAAFQMFVYINPILRTGEHIVCGTEAGMPSCETGEYTPCEIDTANPKKCMHTGYVTITDIGGIAQLEVLRAPDASRPNAAAVHLTLKTQGPPNKLYKETFVLPPIPFQKWTMVTVSREGRAFAIYYNDELVLSKSTMYSIYEQNGQGTTIGASGLTGQVALLNVYPTSLRGDRVAQIYASSVDTRGFPNAEGLMRQPGMPDALGLFPTYNPSLKISLGSLADQLNICGEGGCLSAPAVRPANPLYQWTSPYA